MPNYIHRAMGHIKGELMENFEYKIIEGSAIDCQKKLNQWKHEYIVKVISMCTTVDDIDRTQITILLTRERNGL